MPRGRPPTLFVEKEQRIGRGVVIDPEVRAVFGKHERRAATLLCDCGTVYTVPLLCLVPRGEDGRVNTMSCGCALKDHIRRVRGRGNRGAHFYVHGLGKHPLYSTWKMMLRRCEHPESESYARYGGRDIKVCPEWHDVAVFIADIERIIGPRPKGRTLDRINPNGDYEQTNVKWSTDVEQAQNKVGSVRAYTCTGCTFELRVVGWLAWWLCPACATQNGEDPFLRRAS